jgi:hypothetical protein
MLSFVITRNIPIGVFFLILLYILSSKQFLSGKWLMLNEWIAHKKIINCTNIIDLRNIGSYLYKINCKWENKIMNLLLSEVGSRAVVKR